MYVTKDIYTANVNHRKRRVSFSCLI